MKTLCAVGLVLVLVGIAIVVYEGGIVPQRSGKEVRTAEATLSSEDGGQTVRTTDLGPIDLKPAGNPHRLLLTATGERLDAGREPTTTICKYAASVRAGTAEPLWNQGGELFDTASPRQPEVTGGTATGTFDVPEDTAYHVAVAWTLGEDCTGAEVRFALRRNVKPVRQWALFTGVGVFAVGVLLLIIGRPREAEQDAGDGG